jgi:hypothetical protein
MKYFGFLKQKKTPLARPGNSEKSIHLNLGCGDMYLEGWINIDINPKVQSDICCDLLSVRNHFSANSVDEMMLLHSISYLRLWEARIFFDDAYRMIKPSGRLILEFPDISKCAKSITENEHNINDYLEAVRGIYAFDMGEIKNKVSYYPYAFGWSSWHILMELKKSGFNQILINDPQTHGQRLWRDTRIEAIK